MAGVFRSMREVGAYEPVDVLQELDAIVVDRVSEIFELVRFGQLAVLAVIVVATDTVLAATADVDGDQVVAPQFSVLVRRLEQTIADLMGEVAVEVEAEIVEETADDRVDAVVFNAGREETPRGSVSVPMLVGRTHS